MHVTHSTIDCVALAIRTPVGVVIHTGDYKMDPTPVDGKPFDLHAFARYGQEGVLALFSDSTNVERPGFTPSERAVVVAHGRAMSRRAAKTWWSPAFPVSIHRIQQVIDMAAARGPEDRIRRPQHGGQRRDRARPWETRAFPTAASCGRRIFAASIRSGWWCSPAAARPSRCPRFRASRWTITACSASGENDTVILSARIIPGNEKAIFRMIDHIFRRRVLVYYDRRALGAHPRFRPRQPGRT